MKLFAPNAITLVSRIDAGSYAVYVRHHTSDGPVTIRSADAVLTVE